MLFFLYSLFEAHSCSLCSFIFEFFFVKWLPCFIVHNGKAELQFCICLRCSQFKWRFMCGEIEIVNLSDWSLECISRLHLLFLIFLIYVWLSFQACSDLFDWKLEPTWNAFGKVLLLGILYESFLTHLFIEEGWELKVFSYELKLFAWGKWRLSFQLLKCLQGEGRNGESGDIWGERDLNFLLIHQVCLLVNS